MQMSAPCEHYRAIQKVTPHANGCEGCIALGESSWSELRVCLTCGYVGCCESSQHTHALQHFKTTAHPMLASFERGETWSWCYVHRRYIELEPGLRPQRRSALAALFGRLFRR
jgi:uncharacterized UBP type Zn finger protein